MKDIALFLWQLPQNLLALLWLKFVGNYDWYSYDYSCNGIKVYRTGLKYSVSLGRYIIIPHLAGTTTLQHEYGHCIQSKYLGWLYLPIIGLPSIIWACIYKYTNKDYYWFYTEKLADKLANIKR